MNLKSLAAAFLLIAAVTAGCRETPSPKPRGYFRIGFPEKSYRLYDTACPFTFEYPSYGRITGTDDIKEPCWFNIEFPAYKAKIHFSYRRVDNNLAAILNESNQYAYSHSVKADAITEQPWVNDSSRVFGLLYDIKGNTASSVQFILTDSSRHFLRGALYFSVQPEKDSLAPVIDFFRADIVHLVETFRWK